MFRALVILCLIVCVFIQGCARQRTAMVDRATHTKDRAFNHMTHWPAAEDWLNEHPMVKGTVYCVALGAVVTGVVALIVFGGIELSDP